MNIADANYQALLTQEVKENVQIIEFIHRIGISISNQH